MRWLLAVSSLVVSCDGWGMFVNPPSSTFTPGNVSEALTETFRWVGAPLQLRYAIEPDLCEVMTPLMWEGNALGTWLIGDRSNYTTCERLHDAIHSAFRTWGNVNPEVSFFDVTNRCAAERLWRPVSVERCSESNYCIDAENFTDWKVESTYMELK